jgi:hypothetical protein
MSFSPVAEGAVVVWRLPRHSLLPGTGAGKPGASLWRRFGRMAGRAAGAGADVVFEVLSRSTGWIDQSLRLRNDNETPTIRSYVLISQDEQRAMVYTRDEDGRLGVRACAAS